MLRLNASNIARLISYFIILMEYFMTLGHILEISDIIRRQNYYTARKNL